MEHSYIAAKESAESRLELAQQAELDAAADAEVLGTPADTAALRQAVQVELDALGALRPRAALA